MDKILTKKYRLILLSIILVILPIFEISYKFPENPQTAFESNFERPEISGISENIVIDDKMTTNTLNEGNWSWALSQIWCTGSGTPEAPYLIEYETFMSRGGESLIITNSRKSFIIRNCVINSSDSAGLLLINVTNGKVLDNNIFNNQVGIVLFDVNDTIIANNEVYLTTTDGIYLQYSHYNNISGNIVYNNSECGIDLKDSAFNILTGNTVYNNSWSGVVDISGIYVQTSDFNVLTGNVVHNNSKYGIHLKTSDFNNLSGNTIYDNIEEGIYLQNSDFNNLTENKVYDNKLNGIHLKDSCNNNNITGNTAYDNTQNGMYIENNCNNNDVWRNTVHNNSLHGIFLSKSDYNFIAENNVRDNLYNGIRLFGDENPSDYNNFTDNIIYKNDVGFYFEESCNQNNLAKNILYSNNLGIYFDDYRCDTNSINENFFLTNGKHALDDGTDNNWNSTTRGNYWDNHTGPDTAPQDGIVDIQYNVSGTAASIDYLPIAEDGDPTVTINLPESGDTFDNAAPSLNVRITDDYLDDMWYSFDGGLTNYTFKANGTMEQAAWDATSEGNITLTFYAKDIPGNIGTSEVIIVKDFKDPVVQIISPIQGNLFGTSAPSFTVQVTDDYLDSMWYTLDGGIKNYTFTVNASIDQSAWSISSDGEVTLKFYANDTLGHIGSATVSISKDAIAPIIIINYPKVGETFGSQAPFFNITITDEHLDTIWYSFDDGITTYAIINNTILNQTAWASLSQGDITITFYAKDLAGNEASESVTVVKSTSNGLEPSVIITIVIVSIVGGGAAIAGVYVFIKKRVPLE
jgi:parallel beta-helix repeat protein